MDGKNVDQVEFWNGPAGEKWVAHQDLLDALLAPFAEALLTEAAPAADESIADLGCGCGAIALALADRVGPGGRVLGIDVSRPMLARARERASDRDNVEFVHGDITVHPFVADRFDRVLSRFGVMFFEDPSAAFRNVRTSLRPGGQLAFLCWRPLEDNPWVSLPVGVVQKHLPPAEEAPSDGPGPFSLGDPERIKQILDTAGFDGVQTRPLDIPVRIEGDDPSAFFMNMGPASRLLENATDKERDAIAADLNDALTPFRNGSRTELPSGAWLVTARRG